MKQKLLKFCLWTGKLKKSLTIIKLLLVLLSVFAFQINGSAIAKTTLKSSFAQKVTGKVTDSGNGEPIIGASISIEGTTKGVVTDVDGNFTLDVSENAVLLVTYVGYLTERVTVGTQAVIEVKLVQDITKLEEIVVVGFGTQKKVNLTGAVATMDSKAIEGRPVTNVGAALQGMMPGLNINMGGKLGGSLENKPVLNIRGLTTIGQGSKGDPLVLVDGIEADLNTLNPSDIDNISVLKDAAASSIYGSRAPFGVILVTTKKGKAGKMQITYNGNFRSNAPLLLPDQMDSYTFALTMNTGYVNGGNKKFFDGAHIQRILDFQNHVAGSVSDIADTTNNKIWGDGYGYGSDNTNWFKEIYRKSAPSQEHSLSFTGGSDKITYFLSTDYFHQDGLMKLNQDTYDRYTINAKINAKLSDWASLGYSGRFTREDLKRPTALNDHTFENMARQCWPTLPFRDPNGFFYSSPSPQLALAEGGHDVNQTDWNVQQLNLTLEPIAGWKIFANLNYKIGDQFRHWDILATNNHYTNGEPYYAFQQWYYPNDATSNVHEQAERTNFFSPNMYTEYSKSLGKHNLKVMVGFQSEMNKFRNLGVTRVGVMIPDHPIIDVTSGTDDGGKIVPPAVNGKYEEWATEGVFGRLNYDYDGRYLFEANLRYDGTSRFRSDKRWNYFPSGSVGWVISRENFWKPLEKIVNQFKLRASYGNLGNQNTSSVYPTYQTQPFDPGKGEWLINDLKTNKSWAPDLISTSLTWERVKTYNYGVDLGLLDNRLTGTIDYYQRFTSNMVGPAQELPATLGIGVPKSNNTDLKTIGFELSITWRDRLKNGFGYSVGLNLSDAQSTITKFPNPANTLMDQDETDETKLKYHNGQKYGEIWGYTTIGIAKTDAEMADHLASLPNGGQSAIKDGTKWTLGDIMYKDINGDGKIDNGANTLSSHGDLSVIGNNTPRYTFGFDMNADWKGFDFRAFFQGVLKRDYFQRRPMFFGASGRGPWDPILFKQHLDYFRPDANDPLGQNLNSYYPRPLFGFEKNIQYQTKYIQNAAYIRLKNLQLGYTIPSNISKKLYIEKLRVYISGENLWTKTKLSKIFDPETIDGGWGGNIYPLTKTYSAGVSVTF